MIMTGWSVTEVLLKFYVKRGGVGPHPAWKYKVFSQFEPNYKLHLFKLSFYVVSCNYDLRWYLFVVFPIRQNQKESAS